jgi:hypothetical protein
MCSKYHHLGRFDEDCDGKDFMETLNFEDIWERCMNVKDIRFQE